MITQFKWMCYCHSTISMVTIMFWCCYGFYILMFFPCCKKLSYHVYNILIWKLYSLLSVICFFLFYLWLVACWHYLLVIYCCHVTGIDILILRILYWFYLPSCFIWSTALHWFSGWLWIVLVIDRIVVVLVIDRIVVAFVCNYVCTDGRVEM